MPSLRTPIRPILLAALLCGAATAWGQRVCRVPAGPNHFIVLVDSSGSMSRGGARVAETQRARKRLTAALFGRKGLQNLPKYDPAKDLLTVHEFGIDESTEASHAY